MEEQDPTQEDSLSSIDDVRIAQEFISCLRNADLRNGDLSEKEIDALLNPVEAPVQLDETEDKSLLLGLRVFLAQLNSSQKAYSETMEAIKIAHPDDEVLSFDQIKRQISRITGVYAIVNDMCPKTCMAYTGPLKARESCLRCGQTRLDPITKKPRQQFYTLPIGPVIQAMKREKITAKKMDYFCKRAREALAEHMATGCVSSFNDICCGTDILQQFHSEKITDDDTVLMMSFDGAQLYRNKVSDCWIYIWIFLGLSPCE